MLKKISLLMALLTLTGMLVTGCSPKTTGEDPPQEESATQSEIEAETNTEEQSAELTGVPDPEKAHPVVSISIQDFGQVQLELYPEVAPNTVNNFISLAKSGFYDGLTFHRVINGFMIQGGDPDGKGTGGPGYSIAGEFSDNGFENNLKHTPGVISMARSNNPDSAGSQFFIMHKSSPHLDGAYAAFGQVTEGLDIIDKIAKVKTGMADKPQDEVIMQSVTVELNGYEISDPIIIE
jgi:peptidyl-prolyl cis-trans isomerase B (cyclophilin B)